jgi:hypothetical protein
MTKRLSNREPTDAEIERMLQEGAGRGFWPLSHSEFEWSDLPYEYLNLLFQIDRTKEPQLLLPWILPHVPPEVRPHFIDLFERLEFKTRSKKTPSYRRTEQQQKLLAALDDVKNRPREVKQTDAIEEAARRRGIDKTALTLAVQGQHSSLRRHRR